MLHRLLFLIFLGVSLTPSVAQTGVGATASVPDSDQEIIITGVNNGKNIYVQNPLSAGGDGYCTQEVYLNGSLIYQNPRASAYTIRLTDLSEKAPVEIRIVYGAGCMPKVINPTAIRATNGFRYLAINITEEKVFWTTNGAQRNGKFFLEQGQKESWVPVATVNAQPAYNNYQAEVQHYSGDNEYRIRFLQDDGEMYYSRVEAYNSSADPITFTPNRVADKLYLSKATEYQITTLDGTEVLKGNNNEINVSSLATGVYYLIIENRQEKFFKK
jgi:hypothetical protein